jgi:hypothetical protein
MNTAFLMLTCSFLAGTDMSEIRTIFQTNANYDPRVDLSADAVMVHNHGGSATSTAGKIESWKAAGYPVFRMFFSDSDAGRTYTGGKWDGEDHTDEAETRADGKLIECGGYRPYMIPTDGWTEYLKSLIRVGVDAGGVGVAPEEPLSHTAAGYSAAFKTAYEKEFGEPWVDPRASPDLFFKHSRLLSDLYLEEIRELTRYAKEYAREQGTDATVVLPNHSILSSAAAKLVFPNAAACRETGIDAFIGQVWTGPVGWSLGRYAGEQETRDTGFFESAYLLYSSFANLTKGTSLPMYFLIDPVEDDPKYQWEEYHVWYEKCIVACLMFPSVTRYEVMPWPDRIFLPGHRTGGGTPGPAQYRSELMAVGRVLQEMEDQEEVEWLGGTEGIGVLVSDTMGWIRHGPQGESEGRPGDWNNFHGLTFPLIKKGIPVQVVPIERMGEPEFADEFRVLLLSYNLWKPLKLEYHDWLTDWVKRGGILIFSGVKDVYDDIDMWWKQEGYESPQDHLFDVVGFSNDEPTKTGGRQKESSAAKQWGNGHVVRLKVPPYVFSESAGNAASLRDVVQKALGSRYRETRFWSLRRGRYVAAYSFEGEHTVEGPLVDVFDPDLPYLPRKVTKAQQASLLYLPDAPREGTPALLFHSGRMRQQKTSGREWTLRIAGPLETDGRVRIWAAGVGVDGVAARGPGEEDQLRNWEWDEKNETFVVRFGFHPKGTTISIQFNQAQEKQEG